MGLYFFNREYLENSLFLLRIQLSYETANVILSVLLSYQSFVTNVYLFLASNENKQSLSNQQIELVRRNESETISINKYRKYLDRNEIRTSDV